MTRINELIINGRSSADFPFTVYVTNNAGYNYARKKNVLTETTYGTGAMKNTIDAYPPIQKPYSIYCPSATLQDMREITTWIADEGKLVASDESDVFYEILDVEVSDAPLEATGGYMLDLVFTTMPFGYEVYQGLASYRNGNALINHTNAPMYPRIDAILHHAITSEEKMRIGNQEVRLNNVSSRIIIECKPFEQNVTDVTGSLFNSIMAGDFFEIPPNSTNIVQLPPQIDRIEVLERWAWR